MSAPFTASAASLGVSASADEVSGADMLLAMLVVVIIYADLPHGWQALQRCRPPGGANGVYSHGLVVSRPALKLMQGGVPLNDMQGETGYCLCSVEAAFEYVRGARREEFADERRMSGGSPAPVLRELSV